MKMSGPSRKCFLLSVVVLAGIIIGGATTDRTIYSNTSNQELKGRALRLVNQTRELVYFYKRKDKELMAEYDKKNRPEIRIDERKATRGQWLQESDRFHDSVLRQYKDKYWAEAILLSDELYRRLPKRFRQRHMAAIYQHPTNMLGVEAIADHLELLAKSLPEK